MGKNNKLLISGNRIKQVRKELGLSQSEFASALQTGEKQYISSIENGRRALSMPLAAKISRMYGYPIEWLRGEEGTVFGEIKNAHMAARLLSIGLSAFAAVNGYEITPPRFSYNQDYYNDAEYIISKDGQPVVVSFDDIEQLKDDICAVVADRIENLFKQNKAPEE